MMEAGTYGGCLVGTEREDRNIDISLESEGERNTLPFPSLTPSFWPVPSASRTHPRMQPQVPGLSFGFFGNFSNLLSWIVAH